MDFLKKNINYIPVFEHEFILKPFVIASMIDNKLNKCFKRKYARKLQIIELNAEENKRFIKHNHRQGVVNSKIR